MKEILETHPVANLKAILRKMKQELGSYSKMKKAELIDRIMELKKKGFPVPKVEKYVKPERKKPEKKAEPKKAEKKPAPKKAGEKTETKKPAPSNKVIASFESKYKKIIEKMPKAKSLEELKKLNIEANDVTSALVKETEKFTLTQEQTNRINELTKQVNKTNSKRTKELIDEMSVKDFKEQKKPEPKKTEPKKREPTKQQIFYSGHFSRHLGDRHEHFNDIIGKNRFGTGQLHLPMTDPYKMTIEKSPKKEEITKLIKEVANLTKLQTIELLGKHFKYHKDDLKDLKKGDILRLYIEGKLLKDFTKDPKILKYFKKEQK